MTEERLWNEFVEMMTRTGVFARLAEQCGLYIGRMSNDDREAVLEIALGMAWTGADNFNPSAQSLLLYWDNCLTEAVRTRHIWMQRYGDKWYATTAEEIVEPVYDDDYS